MSSNSSNSAPISGSRDVIPRARETISPVISQQSLSARAFLPITDNHLWRIKTGVVRSLIWYSDGTPVSLGLWGPGDVIGYTILPIRPHALECVTRTELLSINRSESESRLFQLTVLKENLQQLEELMLVRSHRQTEECTAQLLQWLARRFGQSSETGFLLNLRITHQDIADLLGTTRVTITRILGKFEQLGMIERQSGRRVVVKAMESWYYQI